MASISSFYCKAIFVTLNNIGIHAGLAFIAGFGLGLGTTKNPLPGLILGLVLAVTTTVYTAVTDAPYTDTLEELNSGLDNRSGEETPIQLILAKDTISSPVELKADGAESVIINNSVLFAISKVTGVDMPYIQH